MSRAFVYHCNSGGRVLCCRAAGGRWEPLCTEEKRPFTSRWAWACVGRSPIKAVVPKVRGTPSRGGFLLTRPHTHTHTRKKKIIQLHTVCNDRALNHIAPKLQMNVPGRQMCDCNTRPHNNRTTKPGISVPGLDKHYGNTHTQKTVMSSSHFVKAASVPVKALASYKVAYS